MKIRLYHDHGTCETVELVAPITIADDGSLIDSQGMTCFFDAEGYVTKVIPPPMPDYALIPNTVAACEEGLGKRFGNELLGFARDRNGVVHVTTDASPKKGTFTRDVKKFTPQEWTAICRLI